ncbi:hypothetical protein DKQ96_24740 [Salmonella enterica]|uniref:Uncharacterized protein n=2 Tax=Enterobacteriaceae TaxID=543 RepID=A0A7B6F9R9_ECOLX|nr:hypothetical protein [Escherichia coli]EAR1037994.1 hypothetical protein [Salmonella enterica]EAY2727922.1 hypothetical protein [Salmonella enterica subsp. enterica serovar Typhimurium]ECT8088780.1 hypothetical protein [Salmonella enterica subsp. enterica serovar Mbandaka]ECT9191418.1 hypothetical protein [Salmonella enterica subsp. enterica serovar Muenster]MIL68259.1 hypothetical protein [Salmonella enterica subsp. enterica serovar Anatum]OPU80609.1 hypothetical protein BSW12_17675 [Salm
MMARKHIPIPMSRFNVIIIFLKILLQFVFKKNADGIMNTVIAIIGVDNAAITFIISKLASPAINVITDTTKTINVLFLNPRDTIVSTTPVSVPVYAPLVIKIIVNMEM